MNARWDLTTKRNNIHFVVEDSIKPDADVYMAMDGYQVHMTKDECRQLALELMYRSSDQYRPGEDED